MSEAGPEAFDQPALAAARTRERLTNPQERQIAIAQFPLIVNSAAQIMLQALTVHGIHPSPSAESLVARCEETICRTYRELFGAEIGDYTPPEASGSPVAEHEPKPVTNAQERGLQLVKLPGNQLPPMLLQYWQHLHNDLGMREPHVKEQTCRVYATLVEGWPAQPGRDDAVLSYARKWFFRYLEKQETQHGQSGV